MVKKTFRYKNKYKGEQEVKRKSRDFDYSFFKLRDFLGSDVESIVIFEKEKKKLSKIYTTILNKHKRNNLNGFTSNILEIILSFGPFIKVEQNKYIFTFKMLDGKTFFIFKLESSFLKNILHSFSNEINEQGEFILQRW